MKPTARAREVTEAHTRLLRVTLAIEETRAYLEHVDQLEVSAGRALRAFEGRWFGAKSLERVRFLVATLGERFDAFPSALPALRRLRGIDATTRQLICHLHVQLSDPIYRDFTARFLGARREASRSIDRDAVVRWLRAEHGSRWSAATTIQLASKLLSAASEAGLVSGKRDARTVVVPRVTDLALAYALYLLRETEIEGMLTENPYLSSLGLSGAPLDARLRTLPGISFARMGQLTELIWDFGDLVSWAEAT